MYDFSCFAISFTGTSKKKAKHGAALAALQHILGLAESQTQEQQVPPEQGQ